MPNAHSHPYPDSLSDLLQAALQVADRAYAPYSHYQVGAALQTPDGKVFTGCNVENASYPAGICAERSALVKAISEGSREFSTLVVVTANGGAPCGVCRQMLYEFAPDLQVILADMTGEIHLTTTLSALLTHGFGPKNLPKT